MKVTVTVSAIMFFGLVGVLSIMMMMPAGEGAPLFGVDFKSIENYAETGLKTAQKVLEDAAKVANQVAGKSSDKTEAKAEAEYIWGLSFAAFIILLVVTVLMAFALCVGATLCVRACLCC